MTRCIPSPDVVCGPVTHPNELAGLLVIAGIFLVMLVIPYLVLVARGEVFGGAR